VLIDSILYKQRSISLYTGFTVGGWGRRIQMAGRNPTQKACSTTAMNRHARELKCASANKQLDSAVAEL